MAEAAQIPDEAETRARWGGFAWTEENQKKANEILARYPKGREQSCSIPFLDLAQRQVGAETQTQGWLPVPVIEFVARQLGVAYMRIYEVATFYTMFNLAPVGRYHVQVCGTTPCMLRGSDDVLAACKNKGLIKGKTTPDGMFTLTEVECMGNCASAPMVQINDDNYEDLDYDRTVTILEALARGESPKTGTQEPGRHTVEPIGGPTTLTGEQLALTATNAASRHASILVTPTGFFPDLHQALLGLGLGDVAVVRDRDVSRGRRQRAESLDGHGGKLGEVDLVAVLERDDGLLPMRRAAGVLGVLAAGFTPDVGSVDGNHFDLEQLFHRFANLDFVGPPIGHHGVLVKPLGLHSALLADAHRLDDVEGIHCGYLFERRSATFSKAALVNTSLSHNKVS